MKLMSPTDTVLAGRVPRASHARGRPAAVYAPPGAGPEFVQDTYAAMLACSYIQPTFRKRPATTLGGVTNLGWSAGDDVDLEYHVRRSALPAPGRFANRWS